MYPLDNLNLTIDSLYQTLLEKIEKDRKTKDISGEFLSIRDTNKRVFFVYRLIKKYHLIPLIFKEDKCEYSSIHYRNLGNIVYKRKQLHKALQFYNLALMYAPLDSLCYGLAVSNRSAVLAGLKKYRECLEDIKMVFTLSYPSSVKDKLLKRKKLCEDALQKANNADSDDENEQIDDIFTFKGTKHKKYKDASSKLRVKHTPELGRHVIARKNIEVGEIIVQEDPYVSVLLKNQVTITCAYCFSRKCNLYPCPYCCMTMYCSRGCVIQAWDEYHFYECPFIASLLNNNFTKLELLALRTTIKARTDHKTWENVLEAVEEADACTDAEDLGCKQTANGKVYTSDNYESIHTLATNIEKRDVSDLFQKTVSAAVLLHYLAVKRFFETDDAALKKKVKKFTAETLMRHLMTAPTNMHGICANVEDKDGNYVDEYNIGSGAYGFHSLINHSCAPNVVRYTRLGNTQMSLIALRPIKKGMQIFDNYGYAESLRGEEEMAKQWINAIESSQNAAGAVLADCGKPTKNAHHAVHSKESRQAILKSQYKFTCICEACTDDWPEYHELKTVKDLPAAIVQKKNKFLNEKVIEALQKADRKRALELFKPLCELATALEPYIPCKEAAECQESLKQCLAILSGVFPRGFTDFVEFHVPAPRGPGLPVSSRFYTGDGAFDLHSEN